MSLIDEALKRARLEAAQRAAESEGLPYPTIPRHLAPPRRRRWLAPAVLALAVIAGLAVGLLLATRGGPPADRVAAVGGGGAAEPVTSGPASPAELVRDPPAPPVSAAAPQRPPESRAEPRPEPRPPTAAASPPAPESAPAGPPRNATAAKPPRPAAERSGPSEPPAEPAARVPQRPAPPAPPAVEALPEPAAPPQPVAAPPAPPPAATALTDPDSGMLLVLPERDAVAPAGGPAEEPLESHVQQLQLAGGGAIELGGIAWSETGPFALINGRVVGPGSVIGDYTLERIQPGHVELTGEGRRIRLSLQ